VTKRRPPGGLAAAALVAGAIWGLSMTGCHRHRPAPAGTPTAEVSAPPKPGRPAIPARPALPALAGGETFRFDKGVARKTTVAEAHAASLMDVDLGDAWAPFIFQDSGGQDDPPKPNPYRETFVALGDDRVNADGQATKAGEHNYLEVFGIPPTLPVLAARIEEDVTSEREACYDRVDRKGLEQWTGNLGFLDRDRSKRDHVEALRDADWVDKEVQARAAAAADGGAGDSGGAATNAGTPPSREAILAALRQDPDAKTRSRVDRTIRGQARLRAVRAAQARLLCEGLLTPKTRFVDGMYDLPTHEALATWERKNDIFGWGFLGGETLGALLQPTRGLQLDAFKRFLAERVADAAGIVEDGSINQARKRNPPTYRDEAGVAHVVPDLIGDHVSALLTAIGVATPEDLIAFLRSHRAGLSTLHVAFAPPALPPYYAANMALSVDIDRGDVWYDFPFDERGRPIVQRREHYPHLTLFVHWGGQKIPLCWWRTTIGSWRSEVHADGHVYMKYKSSDVGPRVWKHIVAAPVWVPPDGTPAKDLLTRKVLDRNVGPVTIVNTDVMGPGFQSAYGLVLAIHEDPRRGGFDNQIRTHGSDDYTSIARRFSHGCHRLVNNRAVRLFDFILRHRTFTRMGNVPLSLKKRMEVDEQVYRYELKTRGYYYELGEPVAVNVLEGRIMGTLKKPITAYVRKPGVDYSDVPSTGDAATTTAPVAPAGERDLPPETTPELGP
jgi:hypothetical protein